MNIWTARRKDGFWLTLREPLVEDIDQRHLRMTSICPDLLVRPSFHDQSLKSDSPIRCGLVLTYGFYQFNFIIG